YRRFYPLTARCLRKLQLRRPLFPHHLRRWRLAIRLDQLLCQSHLRLRLQLRRLVLCLHRPLRDK
ncbi:hypothetical protein IWW55_005574, partial [Coemansia sp. RSA 2706]